MTKYILFDCDGVLVDSEIIAANVLIRLLKPFGFEMSLKPFMQQFAGMKDNEILSHISEKHSIQLPAYFLHQLEGAIDDTLKEELQAIHGVQLALHTIQLPKAVVSNSPLERVENSLRVAKISHCFDERIFTADMAGKPKPHPDVYLYALKKLGLQPDETIVVEDSPTGVTAAHSAGLKVIGFTGASHIMEGHADKLIACGASLIVARMEDLSQALHTLMEN
ncbi:MAG: HAD family hydrolase [Bacteroidota bacterium]